jgi:hypothetical protein
MDDIDTFLDASPETEAVVFGGYYAHIQCDFAIGDVVGSGGRGVLMTEFLGEALPREMARVRDEVLSVYLGIPTGIFAANMMRADLDAATKALAEGDVIEMIRVYKSLQEWNL